MWLFKTANVAPVESKPQLSQRELLENRLLTVTSKKRILIRRQSYYNQAYGIDRLIIEQYLTKLAQDELEVLVCLDSLSGEYDD